MKRYSIAITTDLAYSVPLHFSTEASCLRVAINRCLKNSGGAAALAKKAERDGRRLTVHAKVAAQVEKESN